jgi:hypothetical protein
MYAKRRRGIYLYIYTPVHSWSSLTARSFNFRLRIRIYGILETFVLFAIILNHINIIIYAPIYVYKAINRRRNCVICIRMIDFAVTLTLGGLQ